MESTTKESWKGRMNLATVAWQFGHNWKPTATRQKGGPELKPNVDGDHSSVFLVVCPSLRRRFLQEPGCQRGTTNRRNRFITVSLFFQHFQGLFSVPLRFVTVPTYCATFPIATYLYIKPGFWKPWLFTCLTRWNFGRTLAPERLSDMYPIYSNISFCEKNMV